MTEAIAHLPTQAPRLKVPATIWTPAEWHLVSHLGGLKQHTEYWIGQIAESHVARLPWLLVEASPSLETAAPPEFFLRQFMALDVEDDDDLAAWCGSWGVPTVPEFLRTERRDPVLILDEGLCSLPGSATMAPKESPVPTHGGPAPTNWTRHPTDPSASQLTWRIEKALVRAAERARARIEIGDLVVRSSPDGPDLRAVQIRSARFAVGLHLAMTRLFTTLPRTVTKDTAKAFDAEALAAIWAPAGVPPSTLADHPDAVLDTLITGTKVLNAMVAGSAASTVQLANASGELVTTRKAHIADLLATEIAVFVAEGLSPKLCEKCGSLFVKQSGRAKYGQYKLNGVKYCNSSCANAAQAQAFRRRKRAARVSGETAAGNQ